MRRRANEPRTINRYFLGIFVPIVLIVSTVISVLLAWNDYAAAKKSRHESQALILETFSATIRQPLLQGSLIEARIRAGELVKNKQVYCVEIQSATENIRSCHKETAKSSGLYKMETGLLFSESKSDVIGHLAITFDNNDLVQEIWRNTGKNAGAFIVLSSILFAALSLGFSKIRKETAELMKIVEGSPDEAPTSAKFSIKEFASVGKNLRRQLEVAKVEAEAKAALGIARQVAHDIRSPVVSLQMALNAARGQVDSEITNVLSHSAQRISDIAGDVINQYTPQGIKHPSQELIKKLPMSANLALAEMVKEKELMCVSSSGIHFKLNAFPEDLLIEMRVSDFKRIISNLVDNAVQAVGDAGLITINCKQSEDRCSISVSDNGIGIPQDVLIKIREDGGSYGKHNGKGLGLQWVRKTIEQYNGELTIDSEHGSGTSVTFHLRAFKKFKSHAESELQLARVEA